MFPILTIGQKRKTVQKQIQRRISKFLPGRILKVKSALNRTKWNNGSFPNAAEEKSFFDSSNCGAGRPGLSIKVKK